MKLFRVYDDKEQCWIKKDVYLTPNGELVMIKKVFGMVEIPIVLNQDRYIYHKAINLRDVNGVEVFEGDYILAKINDDMSIMGLVAFSQELSAYVVLDVNDNKYYNLGSHIEEFITIIGNVFDGWEDISHS